MSGRCASSVLSYKGYEPVDDIVGDLACLFALGVALFPTTPPYESAAITTATAAKGAIHFAFAAAFFLTLIVFSLHLFTKSGNGMTARKKMRNSVYRACGFTMLACILLIAAHGLLLSDGLKAQLARFDPVFWLESSAVVAFGVSWFVKGEAILKD